MSNHRYTVEFRIYGEKLDPESITRELGLQPCRVVKEAILRPHGRIEPMWGYNGVGDQETDWDSLEEGLDFVLTRLWPHRTTIASYTQVATFIWWCGHFQSSLDGGPTLSAGLLSRLGEFGVELFIDNYFEPPDEA